MKPINPDRLADLHADDGDSHVDAIRELAVAIQEIQSQFLVFQSQINNLEDTVSALESETPT